MYENTYRIVNPNKRYKIAYFQDAFNFHHRKDVNKLKLL